MFLLPRPRRDLPFVLAPMQRRLSPREMAPPRRPARAIVNGDSVSDAEAAATGSVGLWIDLSGCSVCRKDKPATCSGTLVAPTLVLSARHCLDTPRMLNGTLERVVFGSDMFGAGASRDVVAVKSTSDYGIETAGNDLLLDAGSDPTLERISSSSSCPAQLRKSLLPSKEEQEEARRKGSPFYPDGLGFPSLATYGYGQQACAATCTTDPAAYSAGQLRRLGVSVQTEIRPWAAGFLTKPVDRNTGTCAGDSGGGALAFVQDPKGRGIRQFLVGVQAVFVNPAAFSEFLLQASRDLGSPLQPTINWREYS
ncbi:hypothetical protein EMIHUDRAFT_218328 [Emiliania huxleyi CCMP1516]|uniref:Peptidase S1 domain-containing protein n=2 Tax=Emiliania huxleyi TaxID=2903 RepID=A0A0D3I929_EMIH1|nr:hypothetical protein EMIHUDRAFT_218328 [Emiliania huxleyi CCMP1516]EOD07764.1 hypothetical protein EMIHUDRAFT_218328 [Emiliania huxleyi CCMP1516]|eukprot:XP_005760193.1 hypothetical protein EMIHUDRAFT_218328 [Emiliania huxleyi CCMP1516]